MEAKNPISLALLEILRGYSIFKHNGTKIYFRHFLLIEHLNLEEYEKDQFDNAIAKGIKTEEQLIEQASKIGYWSKALEEKMKSLEWMVTKSQVAMEKISDNIQRAAFGKSIKKQQQEFDELAEKRAKITLYSAENFASGKRNSKLIDDSLFYDEQFTEAASQEDIFYVVPALKQKLAELSSEKTLAHAAFEGSFFDLFSLNYRDPMKILGKDFFTITTLQKNLLVYANLILNKLQNYEIPDEIRKDPMKILKYSKKETHDGRKETEGVEDLRQKMSKRGGKLKAEDLLS